MQRYGAKYFFDRAVTFRGVIVYAQNLNHGLVRNPQEEKFLILFAVVYKQVVKTVFLLVRLVLKPIKLSYLCAIFSSKFNQLTIAKSNVDKRFKFSGTVVSFYYLDLYKGRMRIVEDTLVQIFVVAVADVVSK